MNRSTKIWLVAAAALAAIGLMVFAGVMTAYRWDFHKLSTMTYETNTYEVNEEFDKISIEVNTTDIAFLPSETEQCRIECVETEKVKHSAAVQNGTLVIHTVDTRKWYEYIGISLKSPKLTVYLPQDTYASLVIDTDTGNIAIPECFTFEDLEIKGSTANVECSASVSHVMEIKVSTGTIRADRLTAEQMDLTATTGNIHIDTVSSGGNIHVETSTGAIRLTEVSCTNLTAKSHTGTVTLKKVVAAENFSIENATGSVKFESSDAAQIYVKTSTGSVTGTLLSEKVFLAKSSTGSIHVPETVTGGKCEIITGTGNITITIQ